MKKQLIGVALGAAACVISRVPYRVFRRPKVTLLYDASALMLILVIIPESA
ncbi:MAG: hypothetical protein ACLUI3_12880 [Christensenellales bacterium]